MVFIILRVKINTVFDISIINTITSLKNYHIKESFHIVFSLIIL